MSCDDVVLEILSEREFSIKGNLHYHDLPVLGREAQRIDGEAVLEVGLLQNPNVNYRGSGETLKMIHVCVRSQPYDSSIVVRGGDDMTEHYETFCKMLEEGTYSLHLFSNSTFQVGGP